MTAETERDRYAQIVSRLEIGSPPRFLLVPRAELNSGVARHANNIGQHKQEPDGTFSIKIVDDLCDPAEIDFVLVHELAHHALHRAGYCGPGHAWPMLAVERILFHKLGWDTESIYADTERTWPKCTFWMTWVLNVNHANALFQEASQDCDIITQSSREIAKWVLSRPPEHEPKYFKKDWDIARKVREMHHTLIADRRSLLFLLIWTVRTLLLGGFGLLLIGTNTGVRWIALVGVGIMVSGILLLFLTRGAIFVWQNCCSAGQSIRQFVQIVVSRVR